jgi:hypothetical protein
MSVALEGALDCCSIEISWFSEVTNVSARSREPAIVDKITRDFPRPISSAMIPPLASSCLGRFAPVNICW